MARGTAVNQLSGMMSNPYPRPKQCQAINTFCELCERNIRTLDWSAHKNSKKHRQAEAIDRGEVQDSNNFNGQLSELATSTNGASELGFSGSGDNNGWAVGENNGWGYDGAVKATSSYISNATGGGGGGDRACYGCGQTGHQKRDCPQSSGGQACFNCGGTGHRKADCDQPPKPMAGGRTCFNCGVSGHTKSECTEPRVMHCRNCGEEGHMSRDCKLPMDWSKVKCRNCNEYGHGAARCPEPAVTASGDDWGTAGGMDTDAGAGAVGGWDATPAEPTTNWADDAAAAAENFGW